MAKAYQEIGAVDMASLAAARKRGEDYLGGESYFFRKLVREPAEAAAEVRISGLDVSTWAATPDPTDHTQASIEDDFRLLTRDAGKTRYPPDTMSALFRLARIVARIGHRPDNLYTRAEADAILYALAVTLEAYH